MTVSVNSTLISITVISTTNGILTFVEVVSVITLDGRVIVVCLQRQEQYMLGTIVKAHSFLIKGTARGFDSSGNVILEKCHERVFSAEGTEIVPLGLYVIRGDSVYDLIFMNGLKVWIYSNTLLYSIEASLGRSIPTLKRK